VRDLYGGNGRRCYWLMKLSSIFRLSELLLSLTGQEVKKRYAGSIGGFVWAFAQPLLTILIYYVVFSLVLKMSFDSHTRFTIVFVAGLIPWFTFVDAVNFGTRSIVSNAHLVTSMTFPVAVLPLVQILSALIVHIAMLVIFLGLAAAHGVGVPWAVLQLPYYTVALCALALGIGWIAAALAVLFRDVIEIVGMCLTLGFWTLPIVWPLSQLDTSQRWLVEDNPMWYVINGYRQSLIYGQWFWSDPAAGLRFWTVTLIVLGLGAWVFRRLRPEFADVL
jgi:teichoic acid transport system permease protein